MLWIAFKFCSFVIDNNRTGRGYFRADVVNCFQILCFAIDNNKYCYIFAVQKDIKDFCTRSEGCKAVNSLP